MVASNVTPKKNFKSTYRTDSFCQHFPASICFKLTKPCVIRCVLWYELHTTTNCTHTRASQQQDQNNNENFIPRTMGCDT